MAEINLERRIRKHVKARTHSIAGICHPAVQDLLRRELHGMGIESRQESPGVELFSGGIEDLYRVHLTSRIAASFRLRLDEFRCGSREDLFSRLRGFPWEYWIQEKTGVRIKMSLSSSRIQHDGRAEESAYKAIQGRMQELYPGWRSGGRRDPEPVTEGASPDRQVIHIQIEHSRARVSLEASGDLLYRRGYAPAQGLAPLRENLAAALIQAAPFGIPHRIVDAMAGSGTFLFETVLSALGLPPLPRRKFAFQEWPVYRRETENFLRRKILREIADRAQGENAAGTGRETGDNRDSMLPAGNFKGVEIAGNVFGLLQTNTGGFSQHLSYLLGQTDTAVPEIELSNEDFFIWLYDQLDPDSLSMPGEPGLLICNPPYNWRVRSESGLYRRIWNLFGEILPGWYGIILMPLNASGRPFLSNDDLPPSSILNRSSSRDFPHGGKRIRALYIHPLPPGS
ncbi:RNA methyltransferase [Salinispira pacifica]|uniref:Methyltransferase n=1 Tax=Salinispira pacifica TaxID=1307761 RepID=V5WK25_9SPIO|nr:RNA methyltransferase [Salinispira pacifica]AHC16162.1 Methyltransferase [Salinispira pacifica]